jgi:hypothetical protein
MFDAFGNSVKLKTVKKELSRTEKYDKERKRKLLAKQGIKLTRTRMIRQMQDCVESLSWFLFVCVSIECTQPTTTMNKHTDGRSHLASSSLMRLTTRSWHVATNAERIRMASMLALISCTVSRHVYQQD